MLEGTAGGLGEAQHRGLDVTRARRDDHVVLRAAQVLGRSVRVVPDPGGLLDGAGAVGVLVDHVEDRVVLELHRRVVPHADHLALGADAGRLLLADRAHAPAAVAGAPPLVGRDLEGLVTGGDGAGPLTGLGQAHRVEQHPTVLADVLTGLLERGDRADPGQVGRHSVLVRLDDEAQLLERTDDLDADRTDRHVHAIAELPRRAHHAVGVAVHDDHEGVRDGQVRVLAVAEDGEGVPVVLVAVEVVAVVEVAVAGGRVADRLGGLVDRIVVPRAQRAMRPRRVERACRVLT